MQYKLGSPSSLPYVHFVPLYVDILVTAYQAADGVNASYEALVDLLESIEHFLSRLRIYTQLPSTLTADEILVKIMMELLSTLAQATKELKQGRSSESSLVDELRCSLQV